MLRCYRKNNWKVHDDWTQSVDDLNAKLMIEVTDKYLTFLASMQ